MTDDHMTEPEIRDYAEALIHEGAKAIGWSDIHGFTEAFAERKTIDTLDAARVKHLISKATVTVHFD
jgi:hypothetical protein